MTSAQKQLWIARSIAYRMIPSGWFLTLLYSFLFSAGDDLLHFRPQSEQCAICRWRGLWKYYWCVPPSYTPLNLPLLKAHLCVLSPPLKKLTNTLL